MRVLSAPTTGGRLRVFAQPYMVTARFAKLIFMRWLHEALAAVLYPALSCRPKPAGPDGIRQERPHLGHVLL